MLLQLPNHGDRQVGAVIEVQAEPVPPDAQNGELAPLVIHPGNPGYGVRHAADGHRAGGLQPSPRVVVRLARDTEVYQPGTVVQHGGLLRYGLEINGVLTYAKDELVLLSVAAHPPVGSWHVELARRRLRPRRRCPFPGEVQRFGVVCPAHLGQPGSQAGRLHGLEGHEVIAELLSVLRGQVAVEIEPLQA